MSSVGGAARSSARATMHVSTLGVSLVATGLKRKCGVCRHPMNRHTAAAGQNVNVVNTVSPTIIVEQSIAPQAHAPMPTPATATAPVAAEVPALTRAQALRELAELKQLGALTEEEFQAEKAIVMGQIPSEAPAVASAQPALGVGQAGLPTGEVVSPGSQAPAPGWYADPTGRHEQRLWDGTTWTASVRTGLMESLDPM